MMKLQSFVSRKERRDRGLSSNSASQESKEDVDLSSIEIDNGSPDRIRIQASQEEILDMVDTNFFKTKN